MESHEGMKEVYEVFVVLINTLTIRAEKPQDVCNQRIPVCLQALSKFVQLNILRLLTFREREKT